METEVVLEKNIKSIVAAQIWMYNEDIVYIKLDSSRINSIGLKEATEICETIVKVCEGRRVKFLTDTLGFLGNVDQGVRERIRHNPDIIAIRAAEAFVANNLALKLIIDFYIRYNRPENPTRVFRNVESALEWLESIDVMD